MSRAHPKWLLIFTFIYNIKLQQKNAGDYSRKSQNSTQLVKIIAIYNFDRKEKERTTPQYYKYSSEVY